MAELPGKIEQEIEKIVTGEGYELVHIDFKPQGRDTVLRVDIDKDGGISLGDLQLVSQQLSTMLDVEDAISSRYELQVSSPGLDRKFYKTSDYQKFLGRLVRIKTGKPVRGLHVIVGHLRSFDGEQIVVVDPQAKKNPEYTIDLNDIKEARLEVEI